MRQFGNMHARQIMFEFRSKVKGYLSVLFGVPSIKEADEDVQNN